VRQTLSCPDCAAPIARRHSNPPNTSLRKLYAEIPIASGNGGTITTGARSLPMGSGESGIRITGSGTAKRTPPPWSRIASNSGSGIIDATFAVLQTTTQFWI